MEPLVTVGQQLKAKRIELGISVDEIADRTRIQKCNLHDLEEDQFSKIVGEVYVKGFLKQYATALGLDPQTMLNLYSDQMEESQSSTASEPAPPQPQQVSRRTLPILATLCLLVGIIIFVVYLAPGIKDTPATPTETSAVPAVKDEAPTEKSEPAPQVGTVAEAVPLPSSPTTEDIDILLPAISRSGSILEAIGQEASTMEVLIDNLPTTTYNFKPGSKVRWHPKSSAHIQLLSNGAVELTLDGMAISFNRDKVINLSRD